ncbi:SAM-dependent methyltransferase [Actinomadura sp. DC4]|uniref:SAM-dependent methyltransferase n=1 Tax=Actinomadura sp. DC4 TaxID=3055069 RepID=UPI0025AFE49C|nr:SAM-dependent methyltransferase [Actinomadura sp. DC4]MDN3351619.1 SAM-dependent methyltransferase [Actinomadura sp. DC4]
MTEQAWLPQGVDAHRPTDARVHDYALGGKDNYAIDRAYAHKLASLLPGSGRPIVENARFVRRAVRHLRALGVRQFLEIGSGLPRRGNVHEVAGPDATVVYVDYDPVAVSHFQAVLSANSSAAAIRGDATKPGTILADPVVTGMIDFDRPVALMMTYMLQLVSDADDPRRIVGEFREPLAAGSHLVLSHATLEMLSPAEIEAAGLAFEELREPVTLRGRAQVTELFDGFELLDPGVVAAPEWRPDRPYRDPTGWVLAGVGRKP